MNLLNNLNPVLNVPESEYIRLLGYPPGHKLEGKAAELANQARDWYNENGKPWVYGIMINDVKWEENALKIRNLKLLSKTLAQQFFLTGANKIMLTVISAGKECEEKAMELWRENKPDEYFFLEIYGSAVVENLISEVSYFLCEWAEKSNLSVLPHYSPGYSGWKIEDQKKLWDLIGHFKNDFPGEIILLESGMLKPKKSMLALFGIAQKKEELQNLREIIPCSSCTFNPCRYRRFLTKSSAVRLRILSTSGRNKYPMKIIF